MAEEKIASMQGTSTSLPKARRERLDRVVEARRRLTPRRRGRAWINGREVGGPDPRFAHLALTHD